MQMSCSASKSSSYLFRILFPLLSKLLCNVTTFALCNNLQCFLTAQVNPKMPRTFGDGVIHQSHMDAMVEVDTDLPEINVGDPTPEEDRIGQLIADNLVQDGATLQMGKYSLLNLYVPDTQPVF